MYDRILVAIDATPSDDNITLQRAEIFAQRWSAIVHLLHVGRGHILPGDITGGSRPVSYTHLTLPTTPYV